MIAIILSFILVALASACNAVMDTIVHHFDTSIFKDFKKRYLWDPTMSWENKYVLGKPSLGRVKWSIGKLSINKPVQITDAFHFFKMWMIIFNCMAIVTVLFIDVELTWYSYLGFLLAYGTTWNTVFSGFYDKILKKY